MTDRPLARVTPPLAAALLVGGLLAACGDGASDSLLRSKPGASLGPTVDTAGGSQPGLDAGAFPEAGVEGNKAEALFRGIQSDLVTTCGGASGVCHVTGAYQSGETPVWLAAPDPYVSIKKYPGIVVSDPYSSKLLLKGPHAGPGFAGQYKDLGDKVVSWLTQEALAIHVAVLPSTDPFTVADGANTVDVSKGGTGVDGAKITFDAAKSDGILTLTNMKLVAPAAAGVHVAHPVFVMVPKSGKPIDDPVDSLSNLDQTQGAGTTQDLGAGTLILNGWKDGYQLKIEFNTLAAATVADAGPTGGCKSVASFTANAVPAMQNNQCLNCHGDANGSGFGSLDLSKLGKDNAAACAQALNQVNKADKGNSPIIAAPTGKVAAHPFKSADGNYASMMLNWINNE